MALFGKDGWRAQGEVFSVWFGLLNRLARYAAAGPASSGWVRRQHFPDGLLGRPWDASLVTLAAIATGAILYDGLSQTELYFDLFGLPDLATSTLVLAGFLRSSSALALLVARRVGMTAMGAGLLPISVGYLIAHYLTYLLGDGQRIVMAIADPFQLGWDLTGTAFYEPSIAWLPPSLVWTVMFSAVVGGHVLGAWAGHLRTDDPSRRLPTLDGRPAATRGGHGRPHDADPLEPRPDRLPPRHRRVRVRIPIRDRFRPCAALPPSGHPLKETSPMRRTLVLGAHPALPRRLRRGLVPAERVPAERGARSAGRPGRQRRGPRDAADPRLLASSRWVPTASCSP